MRTSWLVIALIVISYASIPEQSLTTMAWQFVVDMWHVAESKVGEHTDLIHLIQAAKLVIW